MPAATNSISALILGAGREPPDKDGKFPLPRCLLTDPGGRRVLDWIISGLQTIHIDRITFVGGYMIEYIGEIFPRLNYIYNPEWQTSGVLQSFYSARKELGSRLIVTYADIVYRPSACQDLIKGNPAAITIAMDTAWQQRADHRPSPQEVRKNLVVASPDHRVVDIGFLNPTGDITGEFVGLVYFGPKITPLLQSFLNQDYPEIMDRPFEQAREARQGYMTDLIRHFLKQGVDIHAVDIGGNWAEIDNPAQLSRFVLGTKSDTLVNLAPLIKTGKFCRQKVYTVGQWEAGRNDVVRSIGREFLSSRIAIRSSALIEDSWHSSMAGAFESVLNIDSKNPSAIAGAIDQVVASYSRGGNSRNKNDQILIQEMVRDVVMSGVVFTREINTGASYYVVTYDDATYQTDTVTSGKSNDVTSILVNRSYDGKYQDPRLENLIRVVQELELRINYTALDIEFAIDKQESVFILQVRPITTLTSDLCLDEQELKEKLYRIQQFLEARFQRIPYLFGQTTILGDMPDWNPAEMIGTQPRPLAFSLYNYLIMRSAWRIARGRIGYHNPDPASLMVGIAGHPYVDVRCSFNNLLPAGLPDELAEKLVNHYIEQLSVHPDRHDKVEFEICLTCLDFDYDSKSNRLLENGFSSSEVSTLRKTLFHLTDRVVSGQIEPFEKLMSEERALKARTENALIHHHAVAGIPAMIGQLLDDSIRYGTIPFAILARYAFIANSLLRSIVSQGILTEREQYVFLQSIDTIATHLARDARAVLQGTLDRNDFLVKYGHLRPGTYDITSCRYDEDPERYFNFHAHQVSGQAFESILEARPDPFELSRHQQSEISSLIKVNGFTFTVDQLFNFIRSAISLREMAKFEFTRTVSEILSLLCRFGESIYLSREMLSFLNIESILDCAINVYPLDLHKKLASEIAIQRERFESNRRIRLPHIIFSSKDVEMFRLPKSRPNFITLKKIVAPRAIVRRGILPESLEGRIVMIESADPGHDWIFAHNISGLITKYGGAASHMAIRAAEFGVPAAIGCGETLFERLCLAEMIELNCADKYINAL